MIQPRYSAGRYFRLLFCFTTLGLLGACASMAPSYETPSVELRSFRPIEGQGMMPAFEIGLRVMNPNGSALNLRGISYTVSLEGREIVKGVGNELPKIEAYGEGIVTVTAEPNLIEGMNLISDLMREQPESVDYAFDAKLDVGALYPAIRVRDGGTLALR